MSTILQQDSKSRNQGKQMQFDLADYLLLDHDAEADTCVIWRIGRPEPYTVNYGDHAPHCTCPGFTRHGHCWHSRPSGVGWQKAWEGKLASLAVRSRLRSVVFEDEFMEAGPVLTIGEQESDHRQLLDYDCDIDPWMVGAGRVAA